MMTFWVIAAVALVVALWFVVPALLGQRKLSTGTDRAALESRLQSIEADVQRGVLSRADADREREGIEAALKQQTPSGGSSGDRSPRWGAALALLGLPAAAVALYLQLGGGPQAIETRPAPIESTAARTKDATAVPSPPHTSGTSNLSVEEATARLAARLEREPDDADGWQLLASSYEYLGRTKEAAEAAARAAAIRGGDPVAAPAPGTAVSPSSGQSPVETGRLVDIVSVGANAPAVVADASGPAVGQLESESATRPDDPQSWIALGRAYQASKRYTNAAEAYRKAIDLTPEDPSLLADYADVLAAANGGWLPGEPMQWIDKALSMDPSQPKALWLAATAATQQQDHVQAITLWERLQSALPPGSDDAAAVAANLAEARKSTQSGTSSTESPQAAAFGTVIRGTVKLDPQLAGAIAGDEIVFIFARAADGPRMPLAVVRKQVSELPVSFVLDDSMAMSPSMRLSDFPRVIVGARVSKSGNAMPQPGDLEGLSDVIDAGSSASIDIVIDRKKS